MPTLSGSPGVCVATCRPNRYVNGFPDIGTPNTVNAVNSAQIANEINGYGVRINTMAVEHMHLMNSGIGRSSAVKLNINGASNGIPNRTSISNCNQGPRIGMHMIVNKPMNNNGGVNSCSCCEMNS